MSVDKYIHPWNHHHYTQIRTCPSPQKSFHISLAKRGCGLQQPPPWLPRTTGGEALTLLLGLVPTCHHQDQPCLWLCTEFLPSPISPRMSWYKGFDKHLLTFITWINCPINKRTKIRLKSKWWRKWFFYPCIMKGPRRGVTWPQAPRGGRALARKYCHINISLELL